jgi:hypothetical protein
MLIGGTMPYTDKEKEREYKKQWAKDNPTSRKKAKLEWHQRQRKTIADYKTSKGCEICKEDHPYCLEFHHTDPLTKDFDPSDLIRRGYSAKRVLTEMAANCQILCANCHRKIHWPR